MPPSTVSAPTQSDSSSTQPSADKRLNEGTISSIVAGSILCLLCFAFVFVGTVIATPTDPFAWVNKIGDQLNDRLFEALLGYCTILMALFAISLGSNIVAPGQNVDRMRKYLAAIGFLISSLTITEFIVLVATAFSSPDRALNLVLAAPLVFVVTLVTYQLGSFVLPNLGDQLRQAQISIDQYKRLQQRIIQPEKPKIVVAIVAATITPAIGLAAISEANSPAHERIYTVSLMLLMYALMGLISAAMRYFALSIDSRLLTTTANAIVIVLYASLVWTSFEAISDQFMILWGVVLAGFAMQLLSLFYPASGPPSWIRDCSLSAVVRWFALKSVNSSLQTQIQRKEVLQARIDTLNESDEAKEPTMLQQLQDVFAPNGSPRQS